MGNPAPVFAVENARAAGARTVGEHHLRFTLEDDTGRLSAIAFGQADRLDENLLAAPVNVAFRLEENVWRGSTNLQARVIDVKRTDTGND
jgi:single-stranded-DNA-specific exonuclease